MGVTMAGPVGGSEPAASFSAGIEELPSVL